MRVSSARLASRSAWIRSSRACSLEMFPCSASMRRLYAEMSVVSTPSWRFFLSIAALSRVIRRWIDAESAPVETTGSNAHASSGRATTESRAHRRRSRTSAGVLQRPGPTVNLKSSVMERRAGAEPRRDQIGPRDSPIRTVCSGALNHGRIGRMKREGSEGREGPQESADGPPVALAARVEAIVRAAEHEAAGVRRDLVAQRRAAETEAQRYLADARG